MTFGLLGCLLLVAGVATTAGLGPAALVAGILSILAWMHTKIADGDEE